MWVTAFLWSADTNLHFFLCLGLSVSWWGTSESLKPLISPFSWSFFPPCPSLLLFFPLTLQLIIFPSHICSFSIDKWVHEEKGEKKRHKLSKSYWPTLPDLALGIHISAKEFQEQFFSPFPSVFLGSFSWRPFSSHQVFDPHMSTNSTLYKWINALQLHNWRFGARSPLLTVE